MLSLGGSNLSPGALVILYLAVTPESIIPASIFHLRFILKCISMCLPNISTKMFYRHFMLFELHCSKLFCFSLPTCSSCWLPCVSEWFYHSVSCLSQKCVMIHVFSPSCASFPLMSDHCAFHLWNLLTYFCFHDHCLSQAPTSSAQDYYKHLLIGLLASSLVL